MPVAHTDVDLVAEGLRKQVGLAQRPVGEGWATREWIFAETDLSVAMLQLFDDVRGHGAAGGDVGEILGHLTEAVGGAVGEEKDC